ncbi:MAG: hypothetical protein GY822_28510 [Deltaproteobacteria bacterium]|nr:hypothetical protein [Deltaproteobacteria bacterium]
MTHFRFFETLPCYRASSWRLRSSFLVSGVLVSGFVVLGLTGCPLLTGEVYCRATRDCPEVFRSCDLDGVEDGGIGLCIPGTAPTGIPVPEEALINVSDGGVGAELPSGPPGGGPPG